MSYTLAAVRSTLPVIRTDLVSRLPTTKQPLPGLKPMLPLPGAGEDADKGDGKDNTLLFVGAAAVVAFIVLRPQRK